MFVRFVCFDSVFVWFLMFTGLLFCCCCSSEFGFVGLTLSFGFDFLNVFGMLVVGVCV